MGGKTHPFANMVFIEETLPVVEETTVVVKKAIKKSEARTQLTAAKKAKKKKKKGEEEEEEAQEEEGEEGPLRGRQAPQGPAQEQGVDRGGQEERRQAEEVRQGHLQAGDALRALSK